MARQRESETAADFVRRMGWGRGTCIEAVADDGAGAALVDPYVLEITAVGDAAVLARIVSRGGEPVAIPVDRDRVLAGREWAVVV